MFFSSDFMAECVCCNGVTENCFLKLFQSMVQLYLADCLTYKFVLKHGVSRSFLVADLVW